MKALTLWQPWASLIASDLKRYETRSWSTQYRGKLLIHAAQRQPVLGEKQIILDQLKGTTHYAEMMRLLARIKFPTGCVVAIADLTKCLEMIDGWVETNPEPGQTVIQAKSHLEQAVGIWEPGRFAWRLENVKTLPHPVPCKGGQRLWNPSAEVIEQVLTQISVEPQPAS